MPAARANSRGVHPFGTMAFTILEMLVAMAIFMMMVVLLVSVVSQVNSVWHQTDNQKSRRESARVLLDLMSRDLQSALAPVDANNAARFRFDLNPAGFADTHRSAFFWPCASPGSRSGSDIVTVGYFVRRTSTGSILCRLQAPGSIDSIWTMASSLAPATAPDFQGLAADGVLAMFVTLYDKTGQVLATPEQTYSSFSLPYSAEVALVIADPSSAERMVGQLAAPDTTTTADEFVNALAAKFRPFVQVYRTRVDLPQAR
jgi:type II secretory pathway pseudopilin PulG